MIGPMNSHILVPEGLAARPVVAIERSLFCLHLCRKIDRITRALEDALREFKNARVVKFTLQPQILKKLHLHRERIDKVNVVPRVRGDKLQKLTSLKPRLVAEFP
jgi:hypothetical protein